MARVPHPDVLVMGAAILDGGRVLAARRTTPEHARGLWELPGGKVEPDEDPDEAIVREIREELGCEIAVVDHLTGEQPVKDGYTLRVAVAALVSGEPVPHEHDAIRWLAADELDVVTWLEPDVPFLDQLRRRMDGTAAAGDGEVTP